MFNSGFAVVVMTATTRQQRDLIGQYRTQQEADRVAAEWNRTVGKRDTTWNAPQAEVVSLSERCRG